VIYRRSSSVPIYIIVCDNTLAEEDFLLGFLAAVSSQAHWALRLSLAATFLFHGTNIFLDISGFAEESGLPVVVAFLVAVAEVGGALLVLLGGVLRGSLGDLATRLAALAFIPVLIGAIAMVHWPRWSFEPSQSHPTGGMEFQVALTMISLYLLIKGNNVKAGETSAT